MMAPAASVIVMQAETAPRAERESEAAARALEELETLLERPEPQATLVSWPRRSTSASACGSCCRTRDHRGVRRHRDLAAAQQWIRARVAKDGVEIEPAPRGCLASWRAFRCSARQGTQKATFAACAVKSIACCLYALGEKKITVEDARQVVGPAAPAGDWAIANAIEAGRRRGAAFSSRLTSTPCAAGKKSSGSWRGWCARSSSDRGR